MLLLPRGAAHAEPTLTFALVLCLIALLGGLARVLLMMRWAGPLASWVAGSEAEYRLLRTTAPWKWIGFALGGVTLVTGTIAAIERRLTLRAWLIGIGAVALLIAVFDLPFDDLLLPPNGDV